MESFNENQGIELIKRLGFKRVPINRTSNSQESQYNGIVYDNGYQIGYTRNGNNGMIIELNEYENIITIDRITDEYALGTINIKDSTDTIGYKYDFINNFQIFRLTNPERDILVKLDAKGISVRDGGNIRNINIGECRNRLLAVQLLRREIPGLLCTHVRIKR